MIRLLTWIVLAVLLAGVVCGCNPAQLRPYGVEGYRLYTNWIAVSPYWPEGVPRLTGDQCDAFAQSSWAEHERVYDWVSEQLDKE